MQNFPGCYVPSCVIPVLKWLLPLQNRILKGVCHLPTNTHYIFPKIGNHSFRLRTQMKLLYGLEIIIFRLQSFSFFQYLQPWAYPPLGKVGKLSPPGF